MRSFSKIVPFAAILATAVLPASAQETDAQPGLYYADLADLSLPAQIVAHAEIDRVRVVDAERAFGLAPGHIRLYIEAELISLIRSTQPVPREVRYLVDMPLDDRGRRPRIDGDEFILFANAVPGRPGELQLIERDAQVPHSPGYEATIRQILSEANSPDAAGTVTGVGSAFNVPGSLPGESETQIFLSTTDGRPVSLSIARRPNERPRWNVALGEIVNRATPPPQRGTLLWYRLACFLPPELPASSLEATAGGQAETARADYRLVMRDLGGCPRSRF